jgi:hypothetical protein
MQRRAGENVDATAIGARVRRIFGQYCLFCRLVALL